MADDRRKVGKADRERISLRERYEVSGWCLALGCNATELREAVALVGHMAVDVRAYLEQQRKLGK